MSLNYFKNSNTPFRNYILIISLLNFLIGNSQNYSSDKNIISNFKKEIEKAENLISIKEGNSYQDGIDLFNEIEKEIEVKKDTLFLLDFYKIRAENYFQNFDYDNSINYIKKGFRILKTYENPKYLGLFYELLGVIYYSLEENNKRDLAFSKADLYLSKYGSKEENIDINFNLAVINKEKNDWNNTEKHALKSLQLINETQAQLLRRKYLYSFLAEAYLHKNDLKKAELYLKYIEKEVYSENSKTLLKASFYGIKAAIFEKKGLHAEASKLFAKSNEAYNQLSIERTKQIKASLKEKSNSQLRELENQKLKSEIKLTERNNQYKNFIIALVIILLLFVLIFAIFQYKNLKYRTKMNVVLEGKNKELEDRNNQIKKAFQEKNQFLDSITHELRTPLNAITGATHLLKSDDNTENKKMLIENLSFNADYLLNFIDNVIEVNLLDKTNFENQTKEDFNLNNLLTNCCYAVALENKNRIKINQFFTQNIPSKLNGDTFKLSQLFISLLESFISLKSKTNIDITTKNFTESEKECVLNFIFEYSDFELDDIIFETIKNSSYQSKFETLKEYTNIHKALSILNDFNVTPIINKTGHKLIISFNLSFEINYDINKLSKEIFNKKNNHFKLLLVEDNKVNQLITQKILTSKGFLCETANDGIEALNLIAKNDYSLILMDIMMPQMDGFEASKEIHKIKPQIPIIALTALYEEVNDEKFKKAYFKEVLNKPVKVSILINTIQKYLHIKN